MKTLVMDWLIGSEGKLEDLEQLLDDGNVVYGEINPQGDFQVLTEAEMAAQSLQVLADYRANQTGISHDRASAWLDSIGSENPLSCPQ